jgi:hypothetical protein
LNGGKSEARKVLSEEGQKPAAEFRG